MPVFTCQQCEYSSSGSDVLVNAVIITQNWGAIPFFGASPLRRNCPPILRNDDRIHRYILPRTTVFPQYSTCGCGLLYVVSSMQRMSCYDAFHGNDKNVCSMAVASWALSTQCSSLAAVWFCSFY